MKKWNGKLNRLSTESSPYLLQHAGNPVDWYPWGSEAFARARNENKPVFLSVGYSSCHWCHVMAHECFEDTGIASIMNENFINIKVDREERPDVDHVYMQAVQALTGRGGWPMSIFLTPEGKPFFGGTYFPPQQRYGMPGFAYILQTVKRAFDETRGDIEQHALELQQALLSVNNQVSDGGIDASILDKACEKIASEFDVVNGGFGDAPKFFEPMVMEFLLRVFNRKTDRKALEMVELTLRNMAGGGVYDQVGGGFHRYSTDNTWTVPHFEKMLYDNALLAGLYLKVYQITGNTLYKDVVCGTLDYMLHEMRSNEGGFFSTQDADSDGEEGKYYTWEKQTFDKVVGEKAAAIAGKYWGITEKGNFEGRNILYIIDKENAIESDMLAAIRAALAAQRSKRVKPGTDEKIIASWNGMLLSSLAESAVVFGRSDYMHAAEQCAGFIAERMVLKGNLMHVYKNGKCGAKGFLEDYACVIQGLLDLYSTTFDGRWLVLAIELADSMIALFVNKADGLFYDTPAEDKELFINARNLVDGTTPSGSSQAVRVLLYLSRLTGNNGYRKVVESSMTGMQNQMAAYPRGFANWLCALDMLMAQPMEVSVICGESQKKVDEIKKAIYSFYLPNKIVAADCPGRNHGQFKPEILAGKRRAGDETAVYLCLNNTCGEPVSEASLLSEKLSLLSIKPAWL